MSTCVIYQYAIQDEVYVQMQKGCWPRRWLWAAGAAAGRRSGESGSPVLSLGPRQAPGGPNIIFITIITMAVEIIIIIIITITVNIIIIIIILFVAIRPACIHILNCECSSVVSSSIRILLIIISFYAFSVVVVSVAQMNWPGWYFMWATGIRLSCKFKWLKSESVWELCLTLRNQVIMLIKALRGLYTFLCKRRNCANSQGGRSYARARRAFAEKFGLGWKF